MPGSATSRDRRCARVDAHPRVAFRRDKSVGVPIDNFAAQWLAYAFPCRRFVSGLATENTRLGRRCCSLLLHRNGLAPPTPRRPPGALSPQSPRSRRLERVGAMEPATRLKNRQYRPCRRRHPANVGCGRKQAMKSNYKIAAAVIGSFVLGVGAASVLHAQAKPPAYTFAEIDVKDQDGYTKDSLPKAQASIKESGGKYLAGGFNKAIGLSGAPPP